VDLELEEVKKSIQEIKGKQNNINKKIESNDSKIKSVLDHQSELAGKKNVIDKKIQVLQDELHDATIEKSQVTSQANTIENKINDNIGRHGVIENELTNLKRSSDELSKVSSNNNSAKLK